MRITPLLLKWCSDLYYTMGVGRYDFLHAVIPIMPSGRTISKYCARGASAKDGMQHEAIQLNSKIFHDLYGVHVPMDDPRHTVAMAWDSMKMSSSLSFDFNTKQVTGVGYDKTNSLCAVASHVEFLEQEVDDDNEADDEILGHDARPTTTKTRTLLDTGVEKAVDYLVMIVQVLSADKSIKFAGARYALAKLNAGFLKEHWIYLVDTLYMYVFVAVADGAT
jgi:hypothetical protein